MNLSSQLRIAAVCVAATSFAGAALAAPVMFQNGTATFSQNFDGVWSPDEMIDGITTAGNGWAIYSATAGTNAQTAVWETTTDLNAGSLTLELLQNHGTSHLLGRFRISVTSDDRSTFADGLDNGGDVTANWTVLTPASVAFSAAGMTSTILGDGSVLVGGTLPATATYTVTFNQVLTNVTGLRLEAMEDAALPTNGPGLHSANGNFVVSEMLANAEPVPEPATLTILTAGIAFAARRRRARG